MAAHGDLFQPFFYEGASTFESYMGTMRRDGEWGGNLELQAVSLCYCVSIIVHQLGSRPWAIQHETSARAIHLSYHDGDHYASIRLRLYLFSSSPAYPVVLCVWCVWCVCCLTPFAVPSHGASLHITHAQRKAVHMWHTGTPVA